MRNFLLTSILYLTVVISFGQNIGYDEPNPGSKISIHGNLSVGASYSPIAAPTSGAIIQGLVGIGTSAPLSQLDVNGGLAVGSYAGVSAAPSNGLIISGNVGIGMASPSDKLQINDGNIGIYNDNNTAGTLKFYEPSTSGTNYMAFKAQAMAANVTYTLPAADGASGQVLSTNGSGALSWATAGSGSSTSYSVTTTATDPTTLGLCTFAAYSELGEATVTVNSTSTVVVTQANFSGAFSNAANGMAIRVTRSQTAGSGTVGTAVCYGATYKGNTIFSISAGMSETGITAGTWYYKFWATPNYSAGSQNYSMAVTPH